VEQRILKVEHERMMKLLDEQEVQLAEVMHDEIESVKLEAKAQTEAELEEVKAKAEADLEAARRRALTDVEAVRREMKAELDAQVKTQLRQRETELEAKLRETEADARTHEAALKAQLAAEQLVVCVQPLTHPSSRRHRYISAWNLPAFISTRSMDVGSRASFFSTEHALGPNARWFPSTSDSTNGRETADVDHAWSTARSTDDMALHPCMTDGAHGAQAAGGTGRVGFGAGSHEQPELHVDGV